MKISNAMTLFISYKNDKVFSLFITDVCGLTARVISRWAGRDSPSKRRKPKAAKTFKKRSAYLPKVPLEGRVSRARTVLAGFFDCKTPFFTNHSPIHVAVQSFALAF